MDVGNAVLQHALAGWLKGRGGFLSDELGCVREASSRLQVPTFLQPSLYDCNADGCLSVPLKTAACRAS